jgi:hypothetical protein
VAGVAGGLGTVATGAMEGVALWGMEGEGRTLVGGEAIAFGVAVADAAGALAGGAATDGATEGVALGIAEGEGRTLTVGDAIGVALAAVAVVAAGVALGATVAEGDGRVLTEGEAAGAVLAAVVAVAAAVELGAVVAAGVAAGVTLAVEVSVGLTNFFGGALGGGVASALILVRARSAAERSAIAVQPVSIVNSVTRSFTVRGRGISGTSRITGADTSSSSPRIVADTPSTFCRRKRYRSIGRRLRDRISSYLGPSLTIVVFA